MWPASLLWNLILRAIIIVTVTDGIIFYLLAKGSQRATRYGYGLLGVLVILVTLVPLIINIWFVLWRAKLV